MTRDFFNRVKSFNDKLLDGQITTEDSEELGLLALVYGEKYTAQAFKEDLISRQTGSIEGTLYERFLKRQAKRAEKRKKKKPSLLSIILIVAVTLVIMGALPSKASTYQYSTTTTHYVEDGETLWEIARQYSNNNHDVRKVIDMIEDINAGLTPLIYAGDVISVPLFENMK